MILRDHYEIRNGSRMSKSENVYCEDKESSLSNTYHHLDAVLCRVGVKMYLPTTLNVEWLSHSKD